jgi:endonuclease/exonuclease/phosphatase family metal-dependent hydrolase
MKNSVLVIFFLVSSTVYSQSPINYSSTQKIKLLSWNIYMLPSPIGGVTSKTGRAAAIGELLVKSEYDVIVFQEAFCPTARKIIKELLSPVFHYSVGPANQRKFSVKINSGLWIFSKYPIEETKSIAFKNKSGIDAFSRKGALLVELNVNGQLIQIAGTHMQNAGGAVIRHAQCNEFAQRLLKPNAKAGVPQILCGDFNINRENNESYEFMLASLDAKDEEIRGEQRFSYDREANDLHVEAGSKKELIDYVLVRANGAMVNCENKQVKLHRKQWHKSHQDLSDHFSLEAEIFFSNNLTIASGTRRVGN